MAGPDRKKPHGRPWGRTQFGERLKNRAIQGRLDGQGAGRQLECRDQAKDYGHAGQMKLDEVTGGSPYGASTIAGGDGSRQPTENELEGARYQGRRIAQTAAKLAA